MATAELLEEHRGLARLFGASGLETFWSDPTHLKPFAVHDRPLQELAGLIDLPEWSSIEDVLRMQYDRLNCMFFSLENATLTLRPSTHRQAIDLYESGHTLFFMGIDHPSFTPWKEGVARDLGLHPYMVRMDIFASRRGPGLRCHYDDAAGIAVQLKGRKRWSLAENEHIVDPTINHGLGDPVDPLLALQAPGGFPNKIPENHQTVEMVPGSVMWVPRGAWHQTLTTEHTSMHLLVNPGIPTWRKVVLELLEKTPFFHTPEWRQSLKTVWRGDLLDRSVLTGLADRFTMLAETLRDPDLAITSDRNNHDFANRLKKLADPSQD